MSPNFEIKEQIKRNEPCDPDLSKIVARRLLMAGGTPTYKSDKKTNISLYFALIDLEIIEEDCFRKDPTCFAYELNEKREHC